MADLGHGTTIAFESGFFGNITAASWSGITRAAVDSSTFGTTGGKTFIPGDTYDPGTLSVTMQHNTAATIPLLQAADTVTVTNPDATTMSASGFLTSYSVTYADEEVTEAEAEVKLTGNITGNVTIS